jgi:dienelactone hydrolase
VLFISGSVAGASSPAFGQALRSSVSARSLSFRVTSTIVAIPISKPLLHEINVLMVTPVGRGPFPLIVFIHGYGADAQEYNGFLDDIARKGYVVVGPNFSTNDVVGQTVESNSVIDRLTSPTRPAQYRLIDGRRIAVMGHSLGGQTTYLLGYNSCCRDQRIKAVITLEGAQYDVKGGKFSWSGAPLLIVLGDQDPVIPSWIGEVLLSRTRTAAYLLMIKGGNHSGGMEIGEPGHREVMKTILRFLDAYLGSSPSALRELQAEPSNRATTFTQAHTRQR